MTLDPIQLTQDLIAIPSVSRWSNVTISDHMAEILTIHQFQLERLEYIDENGERKVSLIAKKGEGSGGLAFISHSDTVPGQEQDWAAFSPLLEKGRLLGRGSCDMKGPLAAALVAAVRVDIAQLKKPVYVVIAADEEVGGGGAKQIAAESHLFNEAGPTQGILTEPTRSIPVYAHKGGCSIKVIAHGRAAHTSTEQGISANFLMAPFMAEMAELAKVLKTDESYMNHDFIPPTLGFNMVISDGDCRRNVTAAKTVCELGFRPMPNGRSEELCDQIIAKAEEYGFEVETLYRTPFYISPEADLVQVACQVTHKKAETVSFGTDAFHLKEKLDLLVLGPGDIQQAHTVGESIGVAEIEAAVDIYGGIINRLCL